MSHCEVNVHVICWTEMLRRVGIRFKTYMESNIFGQIHISVLDVRRRLCQLFMFSIYNTHKKMILANCWPNVHFVDPAEWAKQKCKCLIYWEPFRIWINFVFSKSVKLLMSEIPYSKIILKSYYRTGNKMINAQAKIIKISRSRANFLFSVDLE